MKHYIVTLFLALFSLQAIAEKEFVNLTPRPKSVLSYDGRCVIPKSFSVAVSMSLGDSVVAEAQQFVDIVNHTMGIHHAELTRSTQDGFIRVHPYTGNYSNLGPEGYRLTIKSDTIGVTAATRLGYYYAFLSLRKMLPGWVSLGQPEPSEAESTEYYLPIATITDQARFSYRSFMLDCSRHFFSVDEIKRILDIMSIYKMNTFHWHLTDDQGWRAEIKKYPQLTQEGATRNRNWSTPIHMVDDYWWTGEGVWDNHTYGPYYYTQDDMRDIVAYAAERHIEVIPEIEMPGHAVAALVAYPQYSCTPSANREVWTSGGISSDVMNVADPATMQFLYDVIDEICEIFPSRYFHIGGDECPTSAWDSNSLCKSFMSKNSLKNSREIQSYFINQISAYLATKGKQTIVWNESITADKANIEMVKEHNPVIMCWNPCQSAAAKAASLGLDAIITEYHSSASGTSGAGGYYINRRQSADYGEPTGAGNGDDTVEGCYNYIPVPSNVSANAAMHYLGVQGTFWCEHVDSDEYLEYLALPRLICMAESGWSTQAHKDWKNFVSRMVLDTEMLDLGNYVYARHWMPDYQHRVFVNPITDGAILTFTNQSPDRGRCLRDDSGTLYGQGSECTHFVLEAAEKEGQYYIKSEMSGKYLYAATLSSDAQVTLSTKKIAWTFDETTMAGYVAICPANAGNLAINNNTTNATKARLYAHGTGNGASFWKIDSFGQTSIKRNTEILDTNPILYDITGKRVKKQHAKGIVIDGNNNKKMIVK